jgi:hypothetical protein
MTRAGRPSGPGEFGFFLSSTLVHPITETRCTNAAQLADVDKGFEQALGNLTFDYIESDENKKTFEKGVSASERKHTPSFEYLHDQNSMMTGTYQMTWLGGNVFTRGSPAADCRRARVRNMAPNVTARNQIELRFPQRKNRCPSPCPVSPVHLRRGKCFFPNGNRGVVVARFLGRVVGGGCAWQRVQISFT